MVFSLSARASTPPLSQKFSQKTATKTQAWIPEGRPRAGNSLFHDDLVNRTPYPNNRTAQEQDMTLCHCPVNWTCKTSQPDKGREPAGSLFKPNQP
ncbi:hypothetical protein TIFTF001_040703 [Ficus carica]|uniref:Uncharacterized protein n=1 Tax=Ficus carica TaxID=3494 RepID=A0AA87YXJ1_FICCA|nr:hypothetical protein TIFTF001_040699 [Ficus carica]GMN25354.1 hypothetical protein TIFTF001_040703 [Ficus carica]